MVVCRVTRAAPRSAPQPVRDGSASVKTSWAAAQGPTRPAFRACLPRTLRDQRRPKAARTRRAVLRAGRFLHAQDVSVDHDRLRDGCRLCMTLTSVSKVSGWSPVDGQIPGDVQLA